MSRHRNMKQYLDEFDDEANYSDDFDDEDDEYDDRPQVKPKPITAHIVNQVKKSNVSNKETKPSASSKKDVPQINNKPISTSTELSTTSNTSKQAASVDAIKMVLLTTDGKSVSEAQIKSALEKNNWDESAAIAELSTKMMNLNLPVTHPQSSLTRALEERPKSVRAVPIPSASGPSPLTAGVRGFDFSTPSPDDAVLDARKRQDRSKPAVTVIDAAKKPEPTLEPKPKAKQSADEKVNPNTAPIAEVKKTKAEEKRDEEDDAADAGRKPSFSLVVVGHVDAGKSTLMGHMLYDLGYVTQKDMHKFEKESKDLGKASFKYAWVMDEHAEERERGITIDIGVKRFETKQRRIVLLDAPGHKDFVPNMITGAAQADAAILVVPAVVGEFESSFSENAQTKEHAILVHRLGVQRLIVAVNKMDSCDWNKERYDFIKTSIENFLLQEVGFAKQDVLFLPCSGITGDNLVKRYSVLPDWVEKRTLEDCLDALPPAKRPVHKPLRITVTDAYKSMQLGPYAVGGKIEAGVIRVGDTVLLSPTGFQAQIKVLNVHSQATRRAKAGENVEIGLATKDSSIMDHLGKAGIVICDPQYPVPIVRIFTATISTLPSLKYPLLKGTALMFHAHSVGVACTVRELKKTLGPEGKEKPIMVKRNETADVVIELESSVCLERLEDFRPLARFMLRFSGLTVAAGVVTEIIERKEPI